jgi:hypothetical protein
VLASSFFTLICVQVSIDKHGTTPTETFSHVTVALHHSVRKDAARSVKRIGQTDFKEVVDEILTELLGIATLVVWGRMQCAGKESMKFSIFGVLIVKRLHCALTVASFPGQSTWKSICTCATWMYGAKRL